MTLLGRSDKTKAGAEAPEEEMRNRLLLRTLIFAVALILVIPMLGAWLMEARSALAHGTTHRDSLQFYTGATLVRTGHSPSLYDLGEQKSLQRTLLPLEYRLSLDFDFLPFLSPPFMAALLAPLAGLSLPGFYVVTGVFNLTLLAALAIALQRAGAAWPESWRLCLLVLTLVWLPVTWCLLWGQVSILLATSAILGYLALHRRWEIAAGCTLSVLWVKPQYGVLILPSLLIWRRWRAAGGFLAATLALFLMSWATVGLDGLLEYGGLLMRVETLGYEYAMFPASYHSLSGIMVRAFGSGGVAWAVLSSLLIGAALWSAREGFGARGYALVLLTGVLVSPHTHLQDLTLLLPVAALGLEAVKQRQRLVAFWCGVWFALALGLYGLVLNRYLLRDGPLLTVPVMLLAEGLLLFGARGSAVPATVPTARLASVHRP